jgi:hypothetical protein
MINRGRNRFLGNEVENQRHFVKFGKCAKTCSVNLPIFSLLDDMANASKTLIFLALPTSYQSRCLKLALFNLYLCDLTS